MSLRLGALGAGGHSTQCHGPALRLFADANPGVVELAAVCDLDLERATAFAAKFGFAAAYADLDAMLAAEKLDGLLAITPIPATEAVVTRLLPTGIPLLIEKPPGADSAATGRLIEVAERTGTPHMVSFNRRFNPALAKARAWLAEGGEERRPNMILARMLRVARREANFASGTGIHAVDAVCSFLGEPRRVRCARQSTSTPGCYSFNAQLAFVNGATAAIVLAPDAGLADETYEIHGDDYCIRVDVAVPGSHWRCCLRVVHGGREVMKWSAPLDAENAFLDGTLDETEAFVAGLRGVRPLAPTLTEARRSFQAAEAIQRGEGS